MRYDREAYLASQDSHRPHTAPYSCESLLVHRILLRRCGASRFTFHERRSRSQAGC